MIADPRRLQYLEAMGIAAWTSRYRFVNARPTEQSEWEVAAVPDKPAPGQRLQALLETPSSPVARDRPSAGAPEPEVGAPPEPAATPPAVVDKLNAAVTKIVRRPEVQASLREQGFTPASSTPREFQKMINADIDRYTALTESIGLRAD